MSCNKLALPNMKIFVLQLSYIIIAEQIFCAQLKKKSESLEHYSLYINVIAMRFSSFFPVFRIEHNNNGSTPHRSILD